MMMRSHRPRTRRSFAGEADCVLTMRLPMFFCGRICRSRRVNQYHLSPFGRVSFGDDCLDQVARVIDIAAIQNREMICEELQRHDFQNGQEQFRGGGNKY